VKHDLMYCTPLLTSEHDLEQMLIACVAGLAEVARASGSIDRAARLSAALETLAPEPPVPAQVERALWDAEEPGSDPLTRREREVLGLLLEGMSNRQIAHVLVIGVRTVETHVERILRKLGLNNRLEIVLHARANQNFTSPAQPGRLP
jgi:two-component system, NarL family, response regulator LiaR